MTLDDLKIAQAGRITVVGGEGALRRRLLDMGLTPGTHVLVRKMAPLGDPIEIRLRGYELTLRKEDAARIQIREEADCPASCGGCAGGEHHRGLFGHHRQGGHGGLFHHGDKQGCCAGAIASTENGREE